MFNITARPDHCSDNATDDERLKEDKVMDLICYLIGDHPVNICPSRNRRKWMGQTNAYRCLPLLIANAHGWEVRCPVAFEAEWNGGSNKEDVQIIFDDAGSSFLET